MKKLDPKAIWLFSTRYFFSWFLTGFLAFFLLRYIASKNGDTGLGVFSSPINLLIYVLAIIVLSIITGALSYRFFRYELTETGFRKESGIIRKTYVTIPYDRIQNVDIYRGFVARILGLSDLQIQTAGASGYIMAEGRLFGLSKETAEQLRNELIERARHPKSQGL